MTEKIQVIFSEPLPVLYPEGKTPEIPEWFRIFRLGKNPLINNTIPEVNVLAEDLPGIIQQVKARGLEPVVDYHHQTMMEGQMAPAAGWIKDLEARNDGLWVRVEWTPKAREFLLNKEYRYFSPFFYADKKTYRLVDFGNLSLTNNPSLTGLEPLMAQARAEADRAQAAAKNKQEEEVMKSMLVGLLGLKAEATDAEVLAALKPKLALAGTVAEMAQVLALKAEAAPGEIVAALKAQAGFAQDLPLIAQAVGLQGNISTSLIIGRIGAFKAAAESAETDRQELLALKAERAQERAEGMVAEALRTGRTSPAELDRKNGLLRSLALKDGEMFKDLVLTRAEGSVVPIKDIPKQPDGKDKTDADGLTPAERVTCTSLGITAEAFKAEQKRLAEQDL